jgi:hypothetical protein
MSWRSHLSFDADAAAATAAIARLQGGFIEK